MAYAAYHSDMMSIDALAWRLILAYRISSNNSLGWLLFFRARRGRLFEGGEYFQILFTWSRALNILFYFAIKSKNNHIKETEHGLFKCSTFDSLINFHCHYPRYRLISFAGLSSRFTRLIGGRLLFEEIRYVERMPLPCYWSCNSEDLTKFPSQDKKTLVNISFKKKN